MGGQSTQARSRPTGLHRNRHSTKMARLRGRAPRGERLVGKIPHGHWKATTFVAGPRSTALSAQCVIDGLMNGNAFLAYVEQVLAPTLKPADVMLDNLSAHKVPGIREAGASSQTLHQCVFLYARRRSNAGLPDHQPLSSRARGARWHCWTVPAPRPSGKCSGSCNAQPRRRIQSFRP